MPAPLEPWEKAYFDTIRDKRNKVTLVRMEFEGTDVAVVCQEVKGTPIGASSALMPLAMVMSDEMVKRLTFGGAAPSAHDASDFIGETRDEP